LERINIKDNPTEVVLGAVRAAVGHLGGSFDAALPSFGRAFRLLYKPFHPAYKNPARAIDRVDALVAGCAELEPLRAQVRVRVSRVLSVGAAPLVKLGRHAPSYALPQVPGELVAGFLDEKDFEPTGLMDDDLETLMLWEEQFRELYVMLAGRGLHDEVGRLVEGVVQRPLSYRFSTYVMPLIEELRRAKVPDVSPHLATLLRHTIKHAGPELRVGHCLSALDTPTFM
jgi:hypothetical protein